VAGARFLGCPIRIAIADRLAHEPVNLIGDLGRRASRLDAAERFERTVQHQTLLLFISLADPGSFQRLTQETGIAIQVGFHGLDARENGRRLLLRSVLYHMLNNRLE